MFVLALAWIAAVAMGIYKLGKFIIGALTNKAKQVPAITKSTYVETKPQVIEKSDQLFNEWRTFFVDRGKSTPEVTA